MQDEVNYLKSLENDLKKYIHETPEWPDMKYNISVTEVALV